MGKHGADLTGQRFGRLVALERLVERSGGRCLWRCRCDCGRELNVRADALRSGNTKSCGCGKQYNLPTALHERNSHLRLLLYIPKEKLIDYLLSDHYQKYRSKLRHGVN